MKYFNIIVVAVFTALFTASCVGEYENIDQFSGEIVYPAAYDTIIARVGFERIEFDLLKAGRVPADEIKMGKAKNTIVEYDGKQYITPLSSWVNVTGLTESKLYRFKIYTEDEFGNYSIPQTAAIIPYTSKDKDLIEFAPPKLSMSPTSFIAEWSLSVLNSVMMDYCGVGWSYKDAAGKTQTGSTTAPRFFVSNFATSSKANVELTYKVVPRINDTQGTRILDTVLITRTLEVQLPGATTPFTPAEMTALKANGITNFTPASVASVTKLTLPMHVSSFQDLFYFSGLKELDLTGEGLKNILPELGYSGGGMKSMVGGGNWQYFMRRVEKQNDIRISSVATLKDLLESGQLTKVRYIEGTMALDDMFKPFVEKGVVQLIKRNDAFFPNDVFIEPQFWANGLVQDGNWQEINSYSGDFLPRAGYNDITKFDPKNQTVNGDKIDLKLDQLIQKDGKNIYKTVIINTSASFFFALPKEYMFDSRQYRYFKFKMFCGSRAEYMDGIHRRFRGPWVRLMNCLWSFGSNTIYGQEYWAYDYTDNDQLTNDQIRNTWREYTIDINPNSWWGANNYDNPTTNGTGNRRNRVIVMCIGGEPWVSNDALRDLRDKGQEAVLYIADARFSRNP